jgi:hypothetical protein
MTKPANLTRIRASDFGFLSSLWFMNWSFRDDGEDSFLFVFHVFFVVK